MDIGVLFVITFVITFLLNSGDVLGVKFETYIDADIQNNKNINPITFL